jgi:hypothetical protein
MSLASEIRQTYPVAGPLIESFEGITYEDMDSLSFFDREIEADESGIVVESFIANQIDMARYLDCNDSYISIVTKRLI